MHIEKMYLSISEEVCKGKTDFTVLLKNSFSGIFLPTFNGFGEAGVKTIPLSKVAFV